MVNKLPCLYGYISQTSKGNRNHNLFKAINHLRRYNQTATTDELTEEAQSINKALESPLPEDEVTIICQHVLAKEYHTSCWKFKNYCKRCRYGKFHKLFKDSKPKYWKHINENNKIVGINPIPDDEYYPWDILDTSKLTPEQRTNIQMFREQMGIPIAIDQIVKSYGIPIGDKAKREWDKFRKK